MIENKMTQYEFENYIHESRGILPQFSRIIQVGSYRWYNDFFYERTYLVSLD